MPIIKLTHFLLFCLVVGGLQAQEQEPSQLPRLAPDTAPTYYYDTDLLPAGFHAGRREALRKLLPDSGMAVVFAYPVRNRSNDVYYEYHPNPNLYYLTGYREPHGMLMLFKEPQLFEGKRVTEMLFVQPRNESTEMWDGKRLGVAGAKDFLQFENTYVSRSFASAEFNFANIRHALYLLPPGDMRDNTNDRGDLASMVAHFERKIAAVDNQTDPRKLQTLLAELREVKLPEEVELMRRAIDITCMAQRELMKHLEPEMHEYEAEAMVEFVFKSEGAEYPGFPSILGGGENTCTLHYTTNRRHLHSGDLLVADVGAEYHGYTADVARTLPVDGKFTEEQKAIYQLVLQAQKAGIAACKPGNRFWAPHEAARSVLASGLKRLGITENWGDVDMYFVHGTSHYLGLDVHDAGNHGDLKPGNVITVEPGIYIPEGAPCDPKWWNIGVRIEDDILITRTGYENLSDCVVKEVPEVEAAME